MTLSAGPRKVVFVSGTSPPDLERGNTVTQPTTFRRAVVNGKLLSVKQTILFDKLMAESDTFRIQFAKLSMESK